MSDSPPLLSYWLKSEKIYKVESVSKATDEVILSELTTGALYKERFATFPFVYKRVFKVGTVAGWLDRSVRSLHRYESKGITNKQKTYPDRRGFEVRFYTVEDVEELHTMISQVHQGRMGKKGRIVNNSMPDIGTLKLELRRYK